MDDTGEVPCVVVILGYLIGSVDKLGELAERVVLPLSRFARAVGVASQLTEHRLTRSPGISVTS
ncbi:hypothetical protein D3C79_1089170 [compost metagenome]